MAISLSPSNADRWTVCTASPQYIEDNRHRIVEGERGYAIEGNIAHEYASKWLKTGKPHFEQEHRYMVPFLQDYVEFIEARKLPDDLHMVEEKFPLWYMPNRNGYIDSILVHPERIRVTDLKFGEGKAVFATNNKQIATYGRTALELVLSGGVFDFPDTTPVFLDIIQPRCRSGAPQSTWELTLGELIEWTDQNIAAIAKSIIAGLPTRFHASDDSVCQWCDAAIFCDARKAYLYQTEALDVFDIISDDEQTLPEPLTVDPHILSKFLTRKPEIVGWLNKLEEYVNNALDAGKPELAPGWKHVEGKKGHRGWTDEGEAAEVLSLLLPKDVIYTDPKLVSPSQAESLLKGKAGREAIAPYTKQGKAGRVLVPESDDRPSLVADPNIEFENLDEAESFSDIL